MPARIGSRRSPLLIGIAASTHGLGTGLLGIPDAVCALIPGMFIREEMFDAKAVEQASAA